MKLSIKGVALACGIVTALAVAWSVLMALVGKGVVPFNFVNQFYLGLLSPNVAGLIFGTVIAFIDGLVGGAIFAYLYNKLG